MAVNALGETTMEVSPGELPQPVSDAARPTSKSAPTQKRLNIWVSWANLRFRLRHFTPKRGSSPTFDTKSTNCCVPDLLSIVSYGIKTVNKRSRRASESPGETGSSYRPDRKPQAAPGREPCGPDQDPACRLFFERSRFAPSSASGYTSLQHGHRPRQHSGTAGERLARRRRAGLRAETASPLAGRVHRSIQSKRTTCHRP